MAGTAPKTGHKMKFYRNTGTAASPVWSVISEIGDLNIPDLSRGLAELKRRAKDFVKNLPSLIQSIAIEFRLHSGLDAVTFTALQGFFFAGTCKEYAVMSGDITTPGEEGLRIQAIVEQFPWDQPLEDVAGHDVRLATGYMKEGGTELDPAWMLIS